MTKKIQPVIMCGGAGTRVWPESRETMPKQFIALIGKRSTFQETILRVIDPIFASPIVVTNHDYRFLVKEQLADIGAEAKIVIEPSRRDSGPAVAVAAVLAGQQDPESIVAVFASDHVITKRAEFLAAHKKVKAVFYPGLKDHPQHELAKRQMSGFGSMITFETGSLANAARMLKRVRVCSLGESLGGVETLISHPATMTHAALGEKGRKSIGITDGMVRISVGIENVEDIIADLNQALA